jgi:hypothetical protein
LEERAERARKVEEQQSWIEANKCVRRDWREESKQWRTNTDGMLASVTKEMALGPEKEILDKLNELNILMMSEEPKSDDEEKALATLEICFSITSATGERKDKEVAQISHLKHIPTHQEGDVTFNQVYQGQSGNELVDLINPNSDPIMWEGSLLLRVDVFGERLQDINVCNY